MGRPLTARAAGSLEPTPCCTLSCFFFAWFAGIFGAMAMIGVVSGATTDGEIPALLLFGLVLPAQHCCTFGALVLCSRRKGAGSLRADFGFGIDRRHAPVFLGGVALQFVMAVVVAPMMQWLGDGEAPQEIVRDAAAVNGVGASLIMVVSVAVLAPVIEELLYRGLLLRALLRRLSPNIAVLISGTTFGAVHLFDTGLRLAGLPIAMALMGFGVVLAVVALRDQTLSRPILLHMGFNSATVVLLLAT